MRDRLLPNSTQELRIGLESVRLDLRGSLHGFGLNQIAASDIFPRVVRAALIRLCGVPIETANIMPGCTFANRLISIGPDTFVNRDCYFEGPLHIGSMCQIGPRVCIAASSHPWKTGGGFERTAVPLPVSIGDGCWLGAGSIVLPGAQIGNGCVIAAGAVVTKDCVGGMLYAGVPAKAVRRIQPIDASEEGP